MKIRYILSVVLFFFNPSILFAMEQPSSCVQKTDKDLEQAITLVCDDGSVVVPLYFLELSKTYLNFISTAELESLDFFSALRFK